MLQNLDPSLLLLILGTLFGFLIGWLVVRINFVSKYILKKEVQDHYKPKDFCDNLSTQIASLENKLRQSQSEKEQLIGRIHLEMQQVSSLKEKLEEQKWQASEWHKKSMDAFENLANNILEEKSRRFSIQNLNQIGQILQPLQDQIKQFESDIEKRYLESTKEQVSLKKEIESLKDLNQQLSQDANNLVNALKGESKIQGDWGEYRLELLLEKAGLVKNVHYRTQTGYKDHEGNLKKPDFIIHLPEEKHLIIDSKVSLRAYERFFNAESESDKKQFLKEHIVALKNHIKSLSQKNYQLLSGLNAPDYIMLFIPIEPAFTVAQIEAPHLFLDALEKNIVLVTNSTLLATLRTISFIWKQEKQKKNVLEIGRQSGLLYDKFCGFVTDLKEIGDKLNATNKSYQKALKKLSESDKKGDTLIERVERIKRLGAKTSKSLNTEFIESWEKDIKD